MAGLIAGEQRFFEETLPIAELKGLLDGASMNTPAGQTQRIKGLKWLLAMISKGMDVSRFFPDVVRNVITTHIELKKLVYMFLIHYADLDETTRTAALLAVNAFQKDLKSDNELIRALALRTLTSFRVEDIAAVQALAVKECAGDVSPYVRKVSAIAMTKLAPEVRRSLESAVLGRLLLDSNANVVGSAAAAMLHVCPDRIELIHSAFHRLIASLGDLDEWGQIALLNLLQRYVRINFGSPGLDAVADWSNAVLPTSTSSSSSAAASAAAGQIVHEPTAIVAARPLPTRQQLDAFLNDDDAPSSSPAPPAVVVAPLPAVTPQPAATPLLVEAPMDDDLAAVLKVVLPLLMSRNSGVVMAAAMFLWNCGRRSSATQQRVAEALVRLVKNPRPEIRFATLKAVLPLAAQAPQHFTPYVADFFVDVGVDPLYVSALKLDAIALLVRAPFMAQVLTEFETYACDADDEFACASVRAVGKVAALHRGAVARNCLQGLLALMGGGHSKAVASQAVEAAKLIVQRDPDADALKSLLACLPAVAHAGARTAIVWLACEFCRRVPLHACEVLRVEAGLLASEAKQTRLQVLSLAARLRCNAPEPAVAALVDYVFTLADFDADYDVRDRSRLLQDVLATPHASEALFAAKPVGPPDALDGHATHFRVDSLSHALAKAVAGYQELPPWAERPLPASVRRQAPLSFAGGPDTYAHRTSGLFFNSPRVQASLSSSSSSSSSGDEDESASSSDESAAPQRSAQAAVASPSITPPAPQPLLDVLFAPAAATKATAPAAVPSLPADNAVVPLTSLFASHSLAPASLRPVLSRTKGAGLCVDMWFTRQSSAATVVALRFTNTRDEAVSDVRVLADALALVQAFLPIPALAPGAVADAAVEINFAGKWRTPVRLTLATGEGDRFALDVHASVGELMQPALDVAPVEFERRKRLLTGMHETKLVLANAAAVLSRAANLGPLLVLGSGKVGYAARRMDDAKSLVLVSRDDDGNVTVNCEDAVAGMALAEDLRVMAARKP